MLDYDADMARIASNLLLTVLLAGLLWCMTWPLLFLISARLVEKFNRPIKLGEAPGV
jgi:hypothetical protein